MGNKFPRRSNLQLQVAAERQIGKAVDEVEGLGADTRLTEAVILLDKAKNLVADYIDEQVLNSHLSDPSVKAGSGA